METSEIKSSGLSFRKVPASFHNALAGISVLLRSENNAKFHILILVLVIAAGIILKIHEVQWIVVIIASGLVLTAECLNTALEHLCDLIMPGYDLNVKKIKDLGAAGVLLASVAAALAGLLVFIPALIAIIK